MLLVSVGLLFKVGAVPFHSWTPDVYQGAPTPVTGFMAACTKVAAFGAILRLVYVGVAGSRWDWEPVLWAVAILTMVVGSVLTDHPDRHQAPAGLLLDRARGLHPRRRPRLRPGRGRPRCCSTSRPTASHHRARSPWSRWCADGGSEATHLSQWAGLGKRNPVVAGIFAFLLLAFAGIPLTSGFTAKYAVFAAAVGRTAVPVLVVVGVLASAIAAFVYVRVIVLMYFSRAGRRHRDVGDALGGHHAGADASARVATLVLGILPSPLLDLASSSSLFLPMTSAPRPPWPCRRPSPELTARLQDGPDRGRRAACARTIDHDDPFIAQASAHLADAGGKRFRPLLTLLAAELGTGINDAGRRGGGRASS